jgi:uncharacterized coiled-coil protein SlyX
MLTRPHDMSRSTKLGSRPPRPTLPRYPAVCFSLPHSRIDLRVSDGKEMKIALLTVFDENYRAIADRTLPSLRRYADTFGLELLIMKPETQDRPPHWGRITRIREVLQSGFEYCFYVDPDATFVRFDEDIRDHITAAKNLHLCWHSPDNSESYDPIPGHFSTGVMVWRNCPWSIDFLDEIWRQTDFIHHFWTEQAAVLSLLGYRSMLGLGGSDDPDPVRMAHVQTLSVDWNVLVGHTIGPDPIIRHVAGRSYARRLVELDHENAFQTIREILPADARHLLSRQLNSMSYQLKQAEHQVNAEWETGNEKAQAERVLAEEQSKTLEKSISELESKLALQAEGLRTLEENYRAIKSSSSWRITAPLRQLTRLLLRLEPGPLIGKSRRASND